jgi:hypothetical protein
MILDSDQEQVLKELFTVYETRLLHLLVENGKSMKV